MGNPSAKLRLRLSRLATRHFLLSRKLTLHSGILDTVFADPLDFLTHAVEAALQLKVCSNSWLEKKAMDVSRLTTSELHGSPT